MSCMNARTLVCDLAGAIATSDRFARDSGDTSTELMNMDTGPLTVRTRKCASALRSCPSFRFLSGSTQEDLDEIDKF